MQKRLIVVREDEKQKERKKREEAVVFGACTAVFVCYQIRTTDAGVYWQICMRNYGGRLVQVGFLEFRSHLPCGIVTGCDSVRHSLIRDPGDPLRLLLFVPRFIIHPHTCAGVLLSSLSWELTKFWEFVA